MSLNEKIVLASLALAAIGLVASTLATVALSIFIGLV